MSIKIGDKITVNDAFSLLMNWGISGLTNGKEYEVLGVGTPPDGWPSNEGCDKDAVYLLCDNGLKTQLDNDDVVLVE